MIRHITNSEFSESLRHDSVVFEDKAKIGICVSGGPDSLALTILMNNLLKEKNYSLIMLHFNHKLRKSSDKEVKLSVSITVTDETVTPYETSSKKPIFFRINLYLLSLNYIVTSDDKLFLKKTGYPPFPYFLKLILRSLI